MSVYSNFSTYFKLFDCGEALGFYKCPYCQYTTNEKTLKSTHICEFEEDRSEAMLYRCKRCKVKSFSCGWLYFHQKRCTFYKSATGVSNLRKKTELINLNKYNSTGSRKWFAYDHCEYKTSRKDYLNIYLICRHTLPIFQM